MVTGKFKKLVLEVRQCISFRILLRSLFYSTAPYSNRIYETSLLTLIFHPLNTDYFNYFLNEAKIIFLSRIILEVHELCIKYIYYIQYAQLNVSIINKNLLLC